MHLCKLGCKHALRRGLECNPLPLAALRYHGVNLWLVWRHASLHVPHPHSCPCFGCWLRGGLVLENGRECRVIFCVDVWWLGNSCLLCMGRAVEVLMPQEQGVCRKGETRAAKEGLGSTNTGWRGNVGGPLSPVPAWDRAGQIKPAEAAGVQVSGCCSSPVAGWVAHHGVAELAWAGRDAAVGSVVRPVLTPGVCARGCARTVPALF